MAGDLSLVFDHIQLTGKDSSSRDRFNTIKSLSFSHPFQSQKSGRFSTLVTSKRSRPNTKLSARANSVTHFIFWLRVKYRCSNLRRVVDILHRSAWSRVRSVWPRSSRLNLPLSWKFRRHLSNVFPSPANCVFTRLLSTRRPNGCCVPWNKVRRHSVKAKHNRLVPQPRFLSTMASMLFSARR